MTDHQRLHPGDGPVIMPCLFPVDCADCGAAIAVNDPVAWVPAWSLVCETCARRYELHG